MTTVYLVNPATGGHYDMYERLLSEALLACGVDVVACGKRSDRLRSYFDAKDSELAQRFHAAHLNLTSEHLSDNDPLRAWIEVRSRIEQVSATNRLVPDLVFFAWLDGVFLKRGVHPSKIEKIFPFPWSGLYFLPYHLRHKRSLLFLRKGPLDPDRIIRASNCRSIGLLDEGVAELLRSRTHSCPIIPFPDMTDDATPDLTYEPPQTIKHRARGRTVVGLLGGLSRRKGVLSLMRVAARLAKRPFFFVFAGRLVEKSYTRQELEEIREFQQQHPENCYFLFDRIPDEGKFNALVSCCDILSVVYGHFFHSSNILTKAAVFGKQALVSKGYCLEERVKKYGLGLAVNPGDLDSYIEALWAARDQVSSGPVGELIKGRREYCESHSMASLRDSLGQVIASVEPGRTGPDGLSLRFRANA